MIEWSYNQLPVVNRDGHLTGLLDQDAVLNTVVEKNTADSAIKDAAPPTPVRLVMQSIIPHVEITRPLTQTLTYLLTTSTRYVVVLDHERHVQGGLSDASVLQGIRGEARLAWINALQGQGLSELPDSGYSIADLMERDVPTVTPTMSIIDAVRQMQAQKAARMLVVDEQGKMQGLLARSGLLRALLQETR
jgi:predicted transcriptional regulator